MDIYEAKKAYLDNKDKMRSELYEKPDLIYLFFELTRSCNEKCFHCGSSCAPGLGHGPDVEEFKAVLSDIHVINKKLGSGKPRKRKSDKKPSSGANKNREEKERAEEIFEKFKQGGKLSTEELLLLQKYNIN